MNVATLIRELEGTNAKISAARIAQKEKPDYLPGLIEMSNRLWSAASGEIAFSPAVVTLGETPVFKQGTINVIQGKFGVHKSRMAEAFCSLLLAKHSCTTDFLGFDRHKLSRYVVAYIDTERNVTEEFPFAIQTIVGRAGYLKTERPDNFYPTSVKPVPRKERLPAVKAWIEHVRNANPGTSLFAVLDVVTDCVESFNRDVENLELFDYLGNLCDDYKATFLLLIHENFGTDKARGHTGTEAANKSNTVMQVSFVKDTSGSDTGLVALKFLKVRSAARPSPVYLEFSKQAGGLVLADPETVNEVFSSRKKTADIDLVREIVQRFFVMPDDLVQQSEILEVLTTQFECSKNTARVRLKEVVESGNGMVSVEGKPARLIEERQNGKPTCYRLEEIEHDDAGDGEEEIPF